MNKIRGFKIRLRKREILRALKYDSQYASIDQDLEDLIQKQIENTYNLIYPSVVYETYHKSGELFDSVKNEILMGSKKLEEILKNAEAFTLIAASIGSQLEDEVNNIKAGDLAKAFVLDAAGSEAAEQSVNFVSKILREEASTQDCYLSMRFSPGFGDWPLAASEKIFKYIDGSRIDIKLTPEGILMPRKSITAVQAWIPD